MSPELGSPLASAPFETDQADFSSNWELEKPSDLSPFVPGEKQDLDPAHIAQLTAATISNYADIIRTFENLPGGNFIRWFNSTNARRAHWQRKAITAPDAQDHFQLFWQAYLVSRSINMLEFLCYMSVFINEVEGRLLPVSERFGRTPEHPGVAYLFNTFHLEAPDGSLWRKQSYNRSPNNRLAGDLFRDADFNRAHGERAGAQLFRNSTDAVWNGQAYPQQALSTTLDNEHYVCQTDFFKFRGRGVIQTTWRSNYVPLVDFIQRYSGRDDVLLKYNTRWRGKSADLVCTESSTRDWDDLFLQTNNIITAEAVRVHAARSRYLPISGDPVQVNGEGPGSIEFFGNSIGGRGYGERLRKRVWQLATSLVR